MNTKHTPGPWTYTQGETMRRVCSVRAAWKDGNNWVADTSMDNARLIASAPELLSACKAVLEVLERKAVAGHFSESIAALKVAIEKAEGRVE